MVILALLFFGGMNGMRRWLVALILIASLGSGSAFAQTPVLEFRQLHSFNKQEARFRVQLLLDYWKERFGVEHRWEGDLARVHGTVLGFRFEASVTLQEQVVTARASDPGSLSRRLAEEYIGKKLKKYLHPKYEES